MIFLFTDFGNEGPYLGQIRARLLQGAPACPAIDLFSDVPPFKIQEAAYLLAAYVGFAPEGSVFLAVVDPGVGGDRPPLIAKTGGKWFVGPGNGLFEIVTRRGGEVSLYRAPRTEGPVSSTFHGRDVFAPLAARLALDGDKGLESCLSPRFPEWPDDLPRLVYCDGFGNVMTGIRAAILPDGATLELGGRRIGRARTYGDVRAGEVFWYENANGLAEIAVNMGSARELFRAEPGDSVGVADKDGNALFL